MKIKAAGNHRNFKKKSVMSSSTGSGVGSIPLNRSKSPFRLYASVHTEQRTVNTVKIFQNFFMNDGQFLVQPNDPISLTFTAFWL